MADKNEYLVLRTIQLPSELHHKLRNELMTFNMHRRASGLTEVSWSEFIVDILENAFKGAQK
jgi:hypothetical protein